MFSKEIQRLNSVMKQLQQELEKYQRNESQYLGDIERLNNTLRLKVEESTRWEETCKRIKTEFEQKNSEYNSLY